MPQIAAAQVPAFVAWLKKKGVRVQKGRMAVGKIMPTQKDLDMEKVEKLKGEPEQLEKPVIVSGDNRLLDGHHRFAAVYLTDKSIKIPVIKVCIPILRLLKLANAFPASFHKDIHESAHTLVEFMLDGHHSRS